MLLFGMVSLTAGNASRGLQVSLQLPTVHPSTVGEVPHGNYTVSAGVKWPPGAFLTLKQPPPPVPLVIDETVEHLANTWGTEEGTFVKRGGRSDCGRSKIKCVFTGSPKSSAAWRWSKTSSVATASPWPGNRGLVRGPSSTENSGKA